MRHHQILKKLGERLSMLRTDKGFSTHELATLCKEDEGVILLLENGELDCEIHLLLQVSDVLEVKLSELFCFEED